MTSKLLFSTSVVLHAILILQLLLAYSGGGVDAQILSTLDRQTVQQPFSGDTYFFGNYIDAVTELSYQTCSYEMASPSGTQRLLWDIYTRNSTEQDFIHYRRDYLPVSGGNVGFTSWSANTPIICKIFGSGDINNRTVIYGRIGTETDSFVVYARYDPIGQVVTTLSSIQMPGYPDSIHPIRIYGSQYNTDRIYILELASSTLLYYWSYVRTGNTWGAYEVQPIQTNSSTVTTDGGATPPPCFQLYNSSTFYLSINGYSIHRLVTGYEAGPIVNFGSNSTLMSISVSNDEKFMAVTVYNSTSGYSTLFTSDTTTPAVFTVWDRIDLVDYPFGATTSTGVYVRICNPGQDKITSLVLTMPVQEYPNTIIALNRIKFGTPEPKFNLGDDSFQYTINGAVGFVMPTLFGKTLTSPFLSPTPGQFIIGAPGTGGEDSGLRGTGTAGTVTVVKAEMICPLDYSPKYNMTYITAPNIPLNKDADGNVIIPYSRYALGGFMNANGMFVLSTGRTNTSAGGRVFVTVTTKNLDESTNYLAGKYRQMSPAFLLGPPSLPPSNPGIEETMVYASDNGNIITIGIPSKNINGANESSIYIHMLNVTSMNYVIIQYLDAIDMAMYRLSRDGYSLFIIMTNGTVERYLLNTLSTIAINTAKYLFVDAYQIPGPNPTGVVPLSNSPITPPVAQVAIDAYARTMAINYYSGSIYIYGVPSGSTTGQMELQAALLPPGLQQIYEVSLSPSGNMIVVSASPNSATATPALFTSIRSTLNPLVWSQLITSNLDANATSGAYGISLSDEGEFMLISRTLNDNYGTIYSEFGEQATGHWSPASSFDLPSWIPKTGVTSTGRSMFNQHSLASTCSNALASYGTLYTGSPILNSTLNTASGQAAVHFTLFSCNIMAPLPPFDVPIAPVAPPPFTPPPPVLILPPITLPPNTPGIAPKFSPTNSLYDQNFTPEQIERAALQIKNQEEAENASVSVIVAFIGSVLFVVAGIVGVIWIVASCIKGMGAKDLAKQI